jgi:hypothetical protein
MMWQQVDLAEHEIRSLILRAREIFLSQAMLLEIQAPIKVCGDVHGQFYDLLRMFEYGGFPPDANYLFLGDYIDRGKYSLEVICLVFAYKIKYPENFFLLRGNHECASINRVYGFYDECKRRYNIKMWKTFTDCFNCMPVVRIPASKPRPLRRFADDSWQGASMRSAATRAHTWPSVHGPWRPNDWAFASACMGELALLCGGWSALRRRSSMTGYSACMAA